MNVCVVMGSIYGEDQVLHIASTMEKAVRWQNKYFVYDAENDAWQTKKDGRLGFEDIEINVVRVDFDNFQNLILESL